MRPKCTVDRLNRPVVQHAVFIHKAKLFFFFLQRWFRGAVKTQALTSVPNASATTSKSVSVLHMFLKVNKKKRSNWYS